MNPFYAPISFYARSRHGPMLLAALLMMATAVLAIARAYRLAYPDHTGARPLVWLSGVIALAGLLRAQQYFPWEGRLTLEGSLHAVASAAGFVMFAYAAFVIADELKRRPLLVLAMVFLAASAFTCAEAGITLLTGGRPQFMGLEERLILLVAFVWFYVLFPLNGRVRRA